MSKLSFSVKDKKTVEVLNTLVDGKEVKEINVEGVKYKSVDLEFKDLLFLSYVNERNVIDKNKDFKMDVKVGSYKIEKMKVAFTKESEPVEVKNEVHVDEFDKFNIFKTTYNFKFSEKETAIFEVKIYNNGEDDEFKGFLKIDI